MQSSEEVFDRVCQALGYKGSAGFIENESDANYIMQKQILQEAKDKIGIDAIYFIQTTPNTLPVPVVYFKKLKGFDPQEIMNLHKRVWNQGRAPILFAISAVEIRVYDCFEPPPRTKDEDIDKNRLIGKLEQIATEEEIRQKLGEYSREKIDTGGILAKGQFNVDDRADQLLLRNLGILRQELIDEGLDYRFVHSLIGRSIFILYLEDRKALDDFYTSFDNGQRRKFKEILRNKELTYRLFKIISKHFNGDMFPVTREEEDNVSSQNLLRLRTFLEGVDLQTGQSRLWPYSFDVIPIEFISSVYEEFFHAEKNKNLANKKNTHYTPLFIVEFLLDQAMPTAVTSHANILDPSCGSGIFLVAAYRRLIANKRTELNRPLNIDELRAILHENIFGVDINDEAIRVAAFSLYLTMLDYVEPKSLWQREGVFPRLINNNLFPCDFFASDEMLKDKQFDVIIGNTPWESSSSKTLPFEYCKTNAKEVGDRQLAQTFLWKALEFAGPHTTICLMVTAKGLLFNRSGPNRKFRKQFFGTTLVNTIINFSAIRHDIFENAIGPAAAVIYSPMGADEQINITYVVPKPSIETRKLGAIVVDNSDIKEIPRDITIDDDTIWKAAMWGTPRDWELLNRLKAKSRLRDYLSKFNWSIHDGFQVNGGDKNHAPWMPKIRFLPVEQLDKYTIPNNLGQFDKTVFHRPRERSAYSAPLCLIKAAPKKGEIVAAFADEDTCFESNIIGITGKKGDEWTLKILTSFLNSAIAQYFLFLTCSKWGVERDDILVEEYLDLPMTVIEKESEIMKRIVQLHDKMEKLAKAGNRRDELWDNTLREVDGAFYELFEISDVDKDLIQDTIKYTLSFYRYKENSIACQQTDNAILLDYAERVQGAMEMMLDGKKSIAATMYTGSRNRVIAAFELRSEMNFPNFNVVNTSIKLQEVLQRLNKVLTEQVSDRVYFTRIVKIYDGDTIYFVKPNENRYWTKPASYKDADDTIVEILESWSEQALA